MGSVLAVAATVPQLNPTRLGVSIIASVVVLVLLVTVAKLHPFVSLILAGLVVGLGSGYGPVNTIASFSMSFGSTMTSVGILIGLGSMLGRLLMDTGAADSIVDALVDRSSRAMIPWTMAVIGALIGSIIGSFVEQSHISILLLGWLIAIFVRVATGSATVSIMTTAGILGPVMDGMGASQPAVVLLVLAIGAGSIFLSHVNDAGFWLVKEYFGLDVGQTFKTWSVLECLLSVVIFLLVMAVSLFVPIV